MTLETAFAALAVIISLAALAMSSIISLRQLRSLRSANHLPVAIELLTRDYGRPEFQRNERAMIDELPDVDPSGGVSGLPEPLLSQTLQIVAFYDSIGILIVFGCIDEELVLASMNYRIRRVWETLEPFALAERKLRDGPYLDFLEDLAFRAHQADPAYLHDRLGLREFGR